MRRIIIILGFIAGMAGFLLLFKLIILDRVSPADELAPGIVLLLSMVCGTITAFIAARITRHLFHKHNS